MNAKEYTYSVFYSPEDKEFVGISEEFPGMSWLASSQEEALRGIVNAVDELLLEYPAEELPKPKASKKLAIA